MAKRSDRSYLLNEEEYLWLKERRGRLGAYMGEFRSMRDNYGMSPEKSKGLAWCKVACGLGPYGEESRKYRKGSRNVEQKLMTDEDWANLARKAKAEGGKATKQEEVRWAADNMLLPHDEWSTPPSIGSLSIMRIALEDPHRFTKEYDAKLLPTRAEMLKDTGQGAGSVDITSMLERCRVAAAEAEGVGD